jgi:membrane-associated phospholipid phosphatase
MGAEFATQLTFPFRYARAHPWRSALFLGGVAALVSTDHRTLEPLASREELGELGMVSAARWYSDLLSTAGTASFVIGLAAGGAIADSPRERQTAQMLLESIVTTATWTALLKTASGRERPYQAEETVSEWTGPWSAFDRDERGRTLLAFPSGHSSMAWAVSTVIAKQYNGNAIVPFVAYASAAAMSYSRMVVRAHWLSDIVVGSMIGYGCASQVVSLHRKTEEIGLDHRGRAGFRIVPARNGLALEYRF